MDRIKLFKLLKSIFNVLKSLSSQNSWDYYSQNVEIGSNVLIDSGSKIIFCFKPERGVKYITVGSGSQIFGEFTLLTKTSRIQIGQNTQIGASRFICQESISISDDVLISWGITFIDSDTHSPNIEDRVQDIADWHTASYEKGLNGFAAKDWSRVKAKPISIGNRVWIGFNSIILKGVDVGANSVIGAGSVVRFNVDPDTTVIGNPAQVISKNV